MCLGIINLGISLITFSLTSLKELHVLCLTRTHSYFFQLGRASLTCLFISVVNCI